MKQVYRYLLSTFLSFSAFTSFATTSSTDENTIYAHLLGWVTQKNNPYNICNGYYKDLPIIYVNNPLIQSQTNNFDIHADFYDYSFQGTSHLRGNIMVTQPQSRLTADKADMYRNTSTGKINLIKAYGNVSLFQPGTLLVAPEGTIFLDTKKIIMKNATYRQAADDNAIDDTTAPTISRANQRTGQTEQDSYQLNYWGHAKKVSQIKPKHFEFKHATYTTCPPIPGHTCAWHIKSNRLTIDKEKQVAKSYNTVLYLKHIPVFYSPYLSFSLDHSRKSGFLMPSYTHSSSYGYKFIFPFYWNIAPNYDDTITPSYMTERGFMLTNVFRYLTIDSTGNLHLNFLPYDRKFKSFQDTANSIKYPNRSRGLEVLENDSDSRYSIDWKNSTNFNDSWSAGVDYSRVSDDYYIKDLGSNIINNSENQLLQQGQINYQGENWQFTTLMQAYQTLHPVNLAITQNQYERLPEFQLNGMYPQLWQGFDFSMQSAATDFYMTRTPDAGPRKPVIGDRFFTTPEIDYPLVRPYGYLTPQFLLQANQYALNQTGNTPDSPSLVVPTFDAHGGLYFDRDFQLGKSYYKQTLEPELFYLYTPNINQSQLPIFDTTTPTFNYNYLFLTNRFSGIDRIGDANQLTYALTSRFIDNYTGIEKGSISVGEIYYFKNRLVQLCPAGQVCIKSTSLASNTRTLSPIASQAKYNFTQNLTSTGGLTVDPYAREVSYGTLGANYSAKRHLFNLSYDYSKNDPEITGSSSTPVTRLQDINLSSEFLLYRHVDLLGRYSYSWSGNITQDHGNAYLGGIEYNSCCWALRLIGARTFIGVSPHNNYAFENVFYIQFDLKGLGTVDNNDPSQLLTQSITGYKDSFDPEIL